ncbi:MAG: sensor histidine kinase [Planctomycetota bacterium]
MSESALSQESLPTNARFQFGDNVEWKEPDFDDSGWDEVEIPASWTSSIDPWIRQTKGWYRLELAPTERRLKQTNTVLCLGLISDACEVYMNGQLLGGQGIVEPYFDGSPKDPIVLEIPKSAWRQNETQVIAVRVRRLLYGGGILSGPLIVGSPGEILEALDAQNRQRWFWDGAMCSAVLLPFLFSFSLVVSGNRDRESNFLLLASAITLFFVILESRLFLQQFGFSYLRLQLVSWLAVFLPLAFHLLLAALLRISLQRSWQLGLSACYFLIGLGVLSEHTIVAASWFWLLLFAALSITWVLWIASAIRRKVDDAHILLAGVCCGALAAILEVFEVVGNAIVGGQPLSMLGIASFYCCGLWVVARRLKRSSEQVRKAAGSILSAHEDERKRLSREIHDGAMQSMLAIQLRLQIEESKRGENEELRSVIESIKTTGDELRRLSHDLRPDALEKLGLAGAIQSQIEAAKTYSSAKISFSEATEGPILDSLDGHQPPATTDHLYRVFQEALQNALRHSNATEIIVALSRKPNFIQLNIKDNGQGISSQSAKEAGVGLLTIRERASLLGGSAQIRCAKSGGTEVIIEVPIDQTQS